MNSARRLLLAVAVVLVSSSVGFAQGGNQSLSGVVVDSGGGVIPGATVVAKNNATARHSKSFRMTPACSPSPASRSDLFRHNHASGFQDRGLERRPDCHGTQASVKAVLEIGALNETVEVSSRSELVQTQTAAVSSTLIAEQLNEVPLSSRNALYAVNMLPGMQYGSGAGPRAAGINGLPNNTVNITIDGVQTGNMLQSTDGFFSMVTPRLDAVEEITVTGAVPGAGAAPAPSRSSSPPARAPIAWTAACTTTGASPSSTRTTTSTRSTACRRTRWSRTSTGFRQGGPIVIPGLFDGRNKAFFFFNFERLYQPSSATRTRTLLRPEAQAGVFGYSTCGSAARGRST